MRVIGWVACICLGLTAAATLLAAATYDKALFLFRVPSAQLAFLQQLDGTKSGDVTKNKDYRKALSSLIPNCPFHYGTDMPLYDALYGPLGASAQPLRIRDGRYAMLTTAAPRREFMWIDMEDGIVLGGIFFHPSNGEPTPTLTIFSKQINEVKVDMSQLPPAFAEDVVRWSRESDTPLITTRYFITVGNRKVLLEHDEDYCASAGGSLPPATGDCNRLNVEASDVDLNAAIYLEQTHHATNATERMIIGSDDAAWFQLRDRTCKGDADQFGCHIRMTRERRTQ